MMIILNQYVKMPIIDTINLWQWNLLVKLTEILMIKIRYK